MAEKNVSRRTFLKVVTATTAGLTIVPRHVLGGAGYSPPSEKLTRGLIGVGGMGKHHIEYNYAPLLAICDVDSNHLKEALKKAKKAGEKPKLYHDFRELLARPDIDVVEIATPPHWHGLMSVAAAQAGKDVWCEKPMTRTIGEGAKVVKAVHDNGRVFRLNTWFRFQNNWYGTGTTVKPLKKIAASGLLGWPLKITLGMSTGFDWKFYWSGIPGLKGEPVPPELDFDMWLGPAPVVPYNHERVHQKFRGYWDYDGGGLGDMGQHYLDPTQYILGKDDTSPVEIEADCVQQAPDAVLPFRKVTMRYADGCEIILDGSPQVRSDVPLIEGPKGKVFSPFRTTIDNLEHKLAGFPDPEEMITDFTVSVKTRRQFALNENNGFRSATLINLAKIAMRTGGKLKFDPVALRFLNSDDANKLVDQPMRAPWIM